MLYVIEYCYLNNFEDDNSGITRVLKVGYSSNFDHRYQQYCICRDKNLKVLFKIEDGTMKDEQTLHRYLRKNFHQISALGNEWYEKSDDILKFFRENTTIEDIRKVTEGYYRELLISGLFFRSILEVVPVDESLKIKSKRPNSSADILETEENIKELEGRLSYFYSADIFQAIFTIYKQKISIYNKNKEEIDNFITEYCLSKNRLEFLCKTELPSKESKDIVLDIIPTNHRDSYTIVGSEKCKSLGYETGLIKREINIKSTNADELRNEVFSEFVVGNKYSLRNIKLILKNIYDRVGYEKVPKATEMERWFSVKKVSYTEHGKKIHALEILSRLE